MLRLNLTRAMDFVVQEVLSDVARIDTDYIYSVRTISVWHRTEDHGDHSVRYHVLVTARTSGTCVVITLERTDTGRSVSGISDACAFSYDDLIGLYDSLIDDLLS